MQDFKKNLALFEANRSKFLEQFMNMDEAFQNNGSIDCCKRHPLQKMNHQTQKVQESVEWV